MIVLVGASASGKTELAKLLMKKYGIKKAITTTTREMRPGEKNGVDYFFVTKEEFKKKLANDEFVETTQYNGNFYGSTKDQITDDKCIVVDANGLIAYSNIKDKKVIKFFLESSDEIRHKRMIQRGDKIEDIEKRLIIDREKYKSDEIKKNVDFVVNTDDKETEESTQIVFDLYKSVK